MGLTSSELTPAPISARTLLLPVSYMLALTPQRRHCMSETYFHYLDCSISAQEVIKRSLL